MAPIAIASTLSPSAADTAQATSSSATNGLMNCRASTRSGEGPELRSSSFGPTSARRVAAAADVSPRASASTVIGATGLPLPERTSVP